MDAKFITYQGDYIIKAFFEFNSVLLAHLWPLIVVALRYDRHVVVWYCKAIPVDSLIRIFVLSFIIDVR